MIDECGGMVCDMSTICDSGKEESFIIIASFCLVMCVREGAICEGCLYVFCIDSGNGRE